LFAVRCHACNDTISGEYVMVASLEQKFHPNCLCCTTCQTPLKGKKFFCDDDSDEIFCQQHYEKRGTRCEFCKAFITSGVVHAEGQAFHNECYKQKQAQFKKPLPVTKTSVPSTRPVSSPVASVNAPAAVSHAPSACQTDSDDDAPPPPPDDDDPPPPPDIDSDEEPEPESSPQSATSTTTSMSALEPDEGKRSEALYVKYKDMVDSGTAIPFITQGIAQCLESKDYYLFRPDYRKKDLYKLRAKDEEYDFMDYAPRVFYSIRKMFGVSQASFVQSLVKDGINGGKLGEGKSGMLFFFSNDKRFILKTITRAELKFFRKILRSYYTHLTKNPHTLLSRFFGMYKLTMGNEAKSIRLIVMNNLFNTKYKLHEKYDLKGSTRNRYVDTEKEGTGGVLKDLNYKSKMFMGKFQKDAAILQMTRDTEFLTKNNIMDQSLLLGVHNGEEADAKAIKGYVPTSRKDLAAPLLNVKPQLEDLFNCFQRDDGGLRSFSDEEGPKSHLYFLGIIDILQEFNAKKRFESTYKGIRFNKKAISAVSSKEYGARFLDYMTNQIE
jgi:1-phosphatidylinositol-4-phosphate 5-kinase